MSEETKKPELENLVEKITTVTLLNAHYNMDAVTEANLMKQLIDQFEGIGASAAKMFKISEGHVSKLLTINRIITGLPKEEADKVTEIIVREKLTVSQAYAHLKGLELIPHD